MASATLTSASPAGLSAGLVRDGAASSTTFDVLLRASIATRYRARDRWLIAGSYPTEAAARQEYGALAREFPAETVSLMLVRCETEDGSGNLRERVLEKREVVATPQRKGLRPVASARAVARTQGELAPRQPRPRPRQQPPSNTALHWQLVGALAAATLLLALILR